MQILKIGETDVGHMIAAMKVGYNVLLADSSGRNARGNNRVDIINRKIKVDCTFRPLTQSEMSALLAAVEPYVFGITYLDSKSGALKTIQVYISTPVPDYYRIIDNRVLYNPMQLSFIEM